MRSRVLIPSIAFLMLVTMGGYFLINPSYEKSLKAKYYYEIGDYKLALSLAKEAFSIDLYNRMASTIMAQSITSLKYVAYNDEAKKYMNDINQIATHDTISDADKAKIRTMCHIMIGSYIKLAPSVITERDLVDDAARYHDNFEKLLEKVNK
ncbi:MAG: hypothetical protein ACI9RG_001408 [Sulfurimonas sp.]|jgi:hypothetical protein|uniref:hypothetical protein n=1 Tax=Sulfurimonas sp. TaxID=2022749 RepID=UPI0025FD740C|nr:hypothetical protein [Sulfurimonas sp.]